MGDGGRRLDVARDEADAAKPTRIGVRERHAVVERDDQLREPRGPARRVHDKRFILGRALALDGHGARHAEVKQRGERFGRLRPATVHLPPHVLAETPRHAEGAAHQGGLERFRSRPGEDLLVEGPVLEKGHADDGRAEAVLLAERPRGFHLGELGHDRSGALGNAARASEERGGEQALSVLCGS